MYGWMKHLLFKINLPSTIHIKGWHWHEKTIGLNQWLLWVFWF
jgi:hypothetical protein